MVGAVLRALTLTLLVLANVCLVADRDLVNVLSVQIMADLHISRTLFGALNGVTFGLFYAALGVPLGMLADRTSRKWMLAISLAAWSAMTALCGQAGTFVLFALARFGVAAGEAGGVPPSQAVITDLYPRTQRGRAFAVWSLGAPLGIVAGTVLGGYFGAEWGWRSAFIVFALPGLLVSFLIAVFMTEPQRGFSDGGSSGSKHAEPLFSVVRFAASQPSFVHTLLAFTLLSAVAMANATWVPSFLQASYGFDLRQMAAVRGIVLGGASLFGGLAGGYLADRIGRRDAARSLRFTALAMLVATPFGFATYLVDDAAIGVPLLFVPVAVCIGCFGPTQAAMQSLVGVRMRSTAAAFTLLAGSMVGGTLGPLFVGMLADVLEPTVGRDAVRYALFGFSVFTAWSAFHFWRASRTFLPDLARAQCA